MSKRRSSGSGSDPARQRAGPGRSAPLTNVAIDHDQHTTPPEGEIETPADDDSRRWYIVQTYSGYENKVQKNLDQRIKHMDMSDKIFQVVIPIEKEIEIHDGQRREVSRKLFPGYVLVQMVMEDDSWYVVRNTPGVTGFAGNTNENDRSRPMPLSDDEVARILRQMNTAAPRINIGFKVGESVRVTDGPFIDFVGQVDEINLDKGKVRVMVSMFGRETPVELDFLQVEKQ